MKFPKFTLGLLAVALFAAAPSAAVAGRGLLDGGCGCASQKAGGCATQKSGGCATQKGAHVVQKGSIVQNGHVHQKGTVVQKGGFAQKGCGSSKCGGCDSCSICLPRVLPALLHGIDTVLNKVFCCHSCGSSKGCGCATQKGHIAQKGHIVQKGHISQKGGSCSCGSSHPAPSNPFIDDLQPPPVLDSDADARVAPRREVARPVSNSVERPTRSVIKTASATSREPRALPAELVSPVEQIRGARTTMQATPNVIRTSATTTSGLVVPVNPLR